MLSVLFWGICLAGIMITDKGLCIAGIMIANLLLYVRFFMYTAVVNLLPAYLLSKAIANLFIWGCAKAQS